MAVQSAACPAKPVHRYSRSRGLFDYLAAQAAQTPNATAIMSGLDYLTYDQLMSASANVASHLAKAGVKPGDMVAMVASRSTQAVIAMVGIIRAGAAYVPMDPTHAPEQLPHIGQDIPFRAALVASPCRAEADAALPGQIVQIDLDTAINAAADCAPGSACNGDDPAYVLYTSGTTGTPKGVVVAQRGVAAFAWRQSIPGIRPDDVVLHANTIACDGATFEIWSALLNGAALAIEPNAFPALEDLAQTIKRHNVSVCALYTGVFHLLADHQPQAIGGLRVACAGGDVMNPQKILSLRERFPDLEIFNLYGPTEATSTALGCRISNDMLDGQALPLGRVLDRVEALVLDENGRLQRSGEMGQLAVAGPTVALGYLGRDDLSQQAFVDDPRPGKSGKIYLTGDLVTKSRKGLFDFHGRIGRQVKLDGRRIELDGTEQCLKSAPGVSDAAVEIVGEGKQKHLAALVSRSPGKDGECVTPRQIRTYLEPSLPGAAIPTRFDFVDRLPLNPAGKTDRKAVRDLLAPRDTDARPVRASGASDVLTCIAQVWDRFLGCGMPDRTATFFDLGGTSSKLLEAHAVLETELGRKLPITLLFETPKLGDLADRLSSELTNAPSPAPISQDRDQKAVNKAKDHAADGAIVIVGIAGRYPGVVDMDDLWVKIRSGYSFEGRFSRDDLEDRADPSTRNDPAFVPVRPYLENVDMFDAGFFDIMANDARHMDPQARVFLEICVEALNDAGLDPERATGPIGVYAGATMSTYLLANLMPDRARIDDFTGSYQTGHAATIAGNAPDHLAARVAFKLNLKGPAFTVGTACSTSATAIAQAIQTLRSGQADAMLAGGVSITFPQKRGYLATEGGMVSPNGVCRPFDAGADGTVFGHGAGVVVLKRLSDAIDANDQIYAVIRGVGINNDGNDKMSYTAPSVSGQAGAIRAAHRDAGVAPESVSFIECHGSGTPMGDPIEVRGLVQAFGPHAPEHCALGSVKGNFGHLDAASGVTGVIKTALALKHRQIPPMANFQTPNPAIDFASLPYFVPTEAVDWECTTELRAGVSSMGVGGTNVHLVLEAMPDQPLAKRADAPQILPLSAKSPEALGAMVDALAQKLSAPDAPALEDVAQTLQRGRTVYPFRTGVSACNAAQAAETLGKLNLSRAGAATPTPPTVFMFPGQGSQYPGMGAGLYAADPEYARLVDAGIDLLKSEFDIDIRDALTSADPASATVAAVLQDTSVAQPALYISQYALARTWMAKGVRPDLMVGHSVGEFAAAAIAGVFSFETGLRLIADRGRLMQAQAPGDMLSLRCTLDDLAGYLGDGVDIAANNGPALQVVSGPRDAIEQVTRKLEQDGIAHARLHTSHAFHSAMMDPVVAQLQKQFAQCDLQPAQIQIISTVTGQPLTDEQATDPAYWANQARAQVRFQAAIETACKTGSPVFLEVGAGRALTSMTGQILKRGSHGNVFHSLPDHTHPRDDERAMAAALLNLWTVGADVPLDRGRPSNGRTVSLPPYQFQRRRYWIDPPEIATSSAQDKVPAPAVTELPCQNPEIFAMSRKDHLISELTALLSDMSGEDISAGDVDATFTELGFDSLFLGQVSQALARQHGIDLTFRMLLNQFTSISALAAHLDEVLAPDAAKPPVIENPQTVKAAAVQALPQVATAPTQPGNASALDLHKAQLQAMENVFAAQLASLGTTSAAPAMPADTQPRVAPAIQAPVPRDQQAPSSDEPTAKAGYKFGRGPDLSGTDLSADQQRFANELATEYSARFARSKAHTAENRAHHADPRTAAGFHPDWKELVFPIVAERAKGAYIWDLDGNKLIDMVSGFGQSGFGHAPDFVNDALGRQIAKGYAIGPQSDLAGPVARKFAKMVGHERVTFCNTGSEAVMAAIRMARSVTGRAKVVVFSNDYHGQFDEVLIKGRRAGAEPGALPVAPGIPRDNLDNMVVLDYGADAALTWVEQNAPDIAAVLVEPVQSRHPEHRPEAFARALRDITQNAGSALIMDEVVTGFRTHPQGMQGMWGIKADLATYGKVIGGGMAIGAIAGNARFMGALDGGNWSYGDGSTPDIAPTFVAGTFSRHPLVMAAVDATLDHLSAHGSDLWESAPARTARLARRMNDSLARRGLPPLVETYSSWLMINVTRHDPRATLLFALMRLEGIHVMDGFGMFMTTAHKDADTDAVAQAFDLGLARLQANGILCGDADAVAKPSAPVAAAQQHTPLTDSQQEIWMAHQLGAQAACCFNEAVAFDFKGALDRDGLQGALRGVVARHDALRMVFDASGRHFRVRDADAFNADFSDLSTTPDAEAGLAALQEAQASTAFDLTSQLPVRAHLVRLSQDHHVLLLTAHHIACDGWSLGVIFEDLLAIYSARMTNSAPRLAPAPSFAKLARSTPTNAETPATLAFWQDRFRDIPALPELPLDRPRPEHRSFAGTTWSNDLAPDLTARLRNAASKAGVTVFAALFTALQVTLAKASGTDDLVIAVPTSGQAETGQTGLVGHCVNLLPVRGMVDTASTLDAQLSVTNQVLIDALDHGNITFGKIVRSLEIPRTIGRLPLTEIQFNYERAPADVDLSGTTVSARSVAKSASTFDMFVNMSDHGDRLSIEVDYNTDIFDPASIERFIGQFENVLTALVQTPDCRISDMGKQRTITQADATAPVVATPAPSGPQTLPALLAPAFRDHAETTALQDDHGVMSYRDLDRASDRLASILQERIGLRPQQVGVMLPRGNDLIVSLLAVMKAGHAYVPLDPDQPIARLQDIASNARISATIAGTAQAASARNFDVAVLSPTDGAPGSCPQDPAITGETPAYVMFTSGSTGRPKGVQIPHRALVNLLGSMAHTPGLTNADRLLSVTTAMFDISALEFFLPLAQGASVVLPSAQDIRDGFALTRRLEQGDITVMQATPSLWEILLEAGWKPNATLKMLSGGEPLPRDLAQRLLAGGGQLWNLYGPTETTIWSAVKRITDANDLSVGRPIDNTEMVVLDPNDQPVGPGETGELNIGGAGLALGYFGQDDLTASHFRQVAAQGSFRRLYKTGDLARQMPNGDYEILGRIDTQVKLRGFRIELGDIETRLRQMDAVSRAAVAIVETKPGRQRLVAFVVPTTGAGLDRPSLVSTLAQELPDYMVPQDWVKLSDLPHTANGKLDRKALPALARNMADGRDQTLAAPVTSTEKAIAQIWCDCLACETIDVTATLTDLGIDSLDVFRIAARMLDDGMGLEARHMIEHPTIRALATYTDERGAHDLAPAKPSLRDYRNGAKRAAMRRAS